MEFHVMHELSASPFCCHVILELVMGIAEHVDIS